MIETEHLIKPFFLERVEHRTSCRSYRPEPVPKESLEKRIEAARLLDGMNAYSPADFFDRKMHETPHLYRFAGVHC